MSRYRFELAGPADDADLRHVLADTPMPGDIALTFCREPSFFSAPGVDGFATQVVGCRDTLSGRIVGFGCRSLRRVYVNGEPATIGYLSSLRLLAEHRNFGLLARGYRYFRDLHRDGQASLYLTTIAEGNDAALKLLTSGRAGLPAYHAAGRYHTMAIPIGAVARPRMPDGMRLAVAGENDWPMIVGFLQRWGSRRQFFPCYGVSDIAAGGALQGLGGTDVLCAWRGNELVGVLGGWGQQDCRQTVVHSYAGRLRWLRPIYNTWQRLRERPTLPRAGERISYLTAALPIVADDDRDVFELLLRTLLCRAADGNLADFLAVGLAEADPLFPALDCLAGTRYVTRVFHVVWPDGEEYRRQLDNRPTYLELGSL